MEKPNKPKENEIYQQVMAQIKTNQVVIKPRVYFLIGSLLVAASIFIALVMALVFTNLFIFRLNTAGPLSFLFFGSRGLHLFFSTFPWVPLLISLGSFLTGLYLLKRSGIGRRYRLLSVASLLTVIIIAGGWYLDQSGLAMRAYSHRQMPGFLRQAYTGKDWVAGRVQSIDSQELTVETPNGETVNVTIDQDTSFPRGREISPGDQVRAIGEWQEQEFTAEGIVRGQNMRHRQMMPYPTTNPSPTPTEGTENPGGSETNNYPDQGRVQGATNRSGQN